MTTVVTGDYFGRVQVVNVKELKARLSAYLREVARGETFLVTDRGHVVARLTPSAVEAAAADGAGTESEASVFARLARLGARLPQRGPRPSDYERPGPALGLSMVQIDALLNETRHEKG